MIDLLHSTQFPNLQVQYTVSYLYMYTQYTYLTWYFSQLWLYAKYHGNGVWPSNQLLQYATKPISKYTTNKIRYIIIVSICITAAEWIV